MELLNKKNTIKFGLFLAGLAIILLFFEWIPLDEFFYKFKSRQSVENAIETKLADLAAQSLASKDVPVGAILIYKDKVIGTGYNTVKRDSVAYGHAEINAMNEAMKLFGPDNFYKLNRNELFLITTLEPCQMCKGALIEYRIKNVQFMKGKDFTYWFNENRWKIIYEVKKKQVNGAEIQDSLFRLYPTYEK